MTEEKAGLDKELSIHAQLWHDLGNLYEKLSEICHDVGKFYERLRQAEEVLRKKLMEVKIEEVQRIEGGE